MDVQLILHFDGVDVWWAEFSDVPGFTASADTLAELRSVVDDCLPDLEGDVGQPIVITSEVLAERFVAPSADTPVVSPVKSDQERPLSEGALWDTKVLIAPAA